MKILRVVVCIVVAFCSAHIAARAAKDDSQKTTNWTTKSALKQIDKASKNLQGIKAEVQWDEFFCSQKTAGTGKVYVDFQGRLRGEVGGDEPRMVLALPAYVYIYEQLANEVNAFPVATNPHLLVQYALLGFAPAGSALKKEFELKLVKEDTLDDRLTLVFSLTPKAKEISESISSISIWFDPANGLPAQQIIRHIGGLQVTIRYHDVTPDDALPEELFRPTWPEGTQVTAHR